MVRMALLDLRQPRLIETQVKQTRYQIFKYLICYYIRMNKLDLLSVILLVVILTSVPIIYASDLPSGFDEPCPTGQSIIQEVCLVVNILHDRIEVTELDIFNIVNAAIALTTALQTEITSTNFDIDTLSNRTLALEMVTFQTYTKGFVSLKFTLAEYEHTCPEGTQLTGGGHSRILGGDLAS